MASQYKKPPPQAVEIRERSDEWKLAFLRIQLFTAMQTLKDDNLASFWSLIDDVEACRPPVRRQE